jgi:hypothetical protein
MPLLRAGLLRKHQLLYPILKHDPSLVGYWPFDLDDGSYARDRSGYNNHGVIYGATLVPGKVGYARSFDGVDDYGEVPHSDSLNLSSDITMMGWFYQPSSQHAVAICKRYYANSWLAPYYVYGFTLTYNGVVSVRFSSWFANTATGVLTYGEWHHIAATKMGTTVKVYVDGNLVATWTNAPSTIGQNTNSLYIGSGYNTERYKGLIDEVRIYNRALSQAENVRLMNMRGI